MSKYIICSTPEFSPRGLLQRPNTVLRDAVYAGNRKTLNDNPIYSFGDDFSHSKWFDKPRKVTKQPFEKGCLVDEWLKIKSIRVPGNLNLGVITVIKVVFVRMDDKIWLKMYKEEQVQILRLNWLKLTQKTYNLFFFHSTTPLYFVVSSVKNFL